MGVREADVAEANEEKNKLSKEDKGLKWDRSCTDVICCLVFMVFIVATIGLSFIALTTGDPSIIMTPYDSSGNECGKKSQGVDKRDFTDYKYKLFTDMKPQPGGFNGGKLPTSFFNAVCVKECP